MTRLAIVVDPTFPTDALLSNTHLIQAAWCRDYPGYLNFYQLVYDRYPEHLTILDWQHIGAGKAEHTRPMTYDEFFDVIMRLQPKEVIIPDVFGDRFATLASAQQWIDFWESHAPSTFVYKPTFMFIPQGANLSDWLSCLSDGLSMYGEWIDTIGVPKAVQQWTPRQGVLPFINGLNRKIHMLGVWSGVLEMFGHTDVRSWDTSLPVAFAQHARFLKDEPAKKIQLTPGLTPSIEHLVENVLHLHEILD